jgi:hypothetical protein
MSATVCRDLQGGGRSPRTVTLKPLSGLILAILAIAAAASIRVTHDPAGAVVSPPSLASEPAEWGGSSTFVVFPGASVSAGTGAGIKLARTRILRITP